MKAVEEARQMGKIEGHFKGGARGQLRGKISPFCHYIHNG